MSFIRKAEEKDIKRILELLVQVNMVHHESRPDLFKGPATKYDEAELSDIIKDENRVLYVYEDDEDIVRGHLFAEFIKHENDNVLTDIKTLYIDDICVDEDHRGANIGKALFDFAVGYAREMGCYNITLNVWEGNDAAKAFYERCGMKTQKTGMEFIL